LFTLSKRMADAGTPTFCNSSETASAMAFSWPVTPSTQRQQRFVLLRSVDQSIT